MVGLGAVVVLTTSTKSIMKKLTDIFGNNVRTLDYAFSDIKTCNISCIYQPIFAVYIF